MIMSIISDQSVSCHDRKLSLRPPKKGKSTTSRAKKSFKKMQTSEKFNTLQGETSVSVKKEIQDKKLRRNESRTFLDCLELKPVNADQENEVSDCQRKEKLEDASTENKSQSKVCGSVSVLKRCKKRIKKKKRGIMKNSQKSDVTPQQYSDDIEQSVASDRNLTALALKICSKKKLKHSGCKVENSEEFSAMHSEKCVDQQCSDNTEQSAVSDRNLAALALKKCRKKKLKNSGCKVEKSEEVSAVHSEKCVDNTDLKLPLNIETSVNESIMSLNLDPLDNTQIESGASACEKIAVSQKVYVFRDVNKVAVNTDTDESKNEVTSDDLLSAVDLNRQGKKRRYDKLMKRLMDGEKNLEINLKEVQHSDVEKSDIDQCVERMKEKLRVREKKKYEYLINYMRDQWRVDQKSFEDLLPQKVDAVKADIVKQLGVQSEKFAAEKFVPEKRMRGRPRKVCPLTENAKDTSPSKKLAANRSKRDKKRKLNAANKGFPVKFPKSLLSDRNDSENSYKCEKFRVGIIDRNGEREVIELDHDTLGVKSFKTTLKTIVTSKNDTKTQGKRQQLSKETSTAATTNTESTTREGENDQATSDEASKVKQELHLLPTSEKKKSQDSKGSSSSAKISILETLHNLPPTTITLPSVSSLEKDYELVSLSPSCPPKVGNLHTDHFFVPQSTFDQDGKTSIIMVGPFCLTYDPKPRLLLVPPAERRKGPTMILRRKVHSPSKTPPRDFRIRKNTRWSQLSEKAISAHKEGQQGDPALILHDHDYMTPPEQRDNVKRYCKAIAKHSANAKFIDARVEDITEGDDNFVVTIKGDNVLRQVKKLAHPSQAPKQYDKDGMPVIYSLSQVMTPALRKAEEMAKREEMVALSQKTGDYSQIMFPLSAMGDVVMEVLIPPGGTEVLVLPRSRVRSVQCVEDPLKAEPPVSRKPDQSFGIGGQTVRFLHCRDTIDVDGDEGQVQDLFDMTLVNNLSDDDEGEEQVVVENAASVDAGSRPGLPCCRMCLRLFPSDYALFTHVRSNHPVYETGDNVYLEELRARSRLACPVCCNPSVYLATPLKLRRHLRQNHGIEHYVETCNFCRAEFLDKQELELHMELSHSIFSHDGFINMMKPAHSGHFIRGQQSLMSDFLSCSRCDIVFTDRASLLSHTLKVHPELNQFNVCRLCDRVFDSGLSLHKHLKKAHEQTHNGALKCPFCPAWLPTMEMASVHRMSLHSGAVPVHCPFCGAGYQSLHPMYNHVRNQHLQTEAHVCPQCQTNFPSNRSLSEHIRKVHLMSPHIMKSSLDGTDSTTYCCPFCTVSFVRTYDLAVHVIDVHKDHLLPVQCHLCMQSFVSDDVMKMHMSGAHAVDVDLQDSVGEGSFMHEHYNHSDSVTVVLDDVGDSMYSHSKGLDVTGRSGRGMARGHMINSQDIMETEEADSYIQDLDEQDTETIVYLNERNEVINAGDVFGSCSRMEDVPMLSEDADSFNLQGTDYLETLTNDSIAVAADVVTDGTLDAMTSGRHVDCVQSSQSQDMHRMDGRYNIDGVLYQLAPSYDSSHYSRAAGDLISVDAGDLGVADDRMTADHDDFAQLLRQQTQ